MEDTKPRLVIFSGAGLSADSGIQTFRDSNGLWMNHNVDQVANGLTWKNNWDVVRKFYNARRTELGTVEPNSMHRFIADWQKQYPTVVFTQNIDNLLERAGCTDVIHLHGNLTELKCEACGTVWDVGYSEHGETDRCTYFKCNSLKGVRPNVVFFHETAPNYRVMYNVFSSLTEKDCVLVIGTSGQVIDINSLIFDRPGMKILNNLAPSAFINDSYFNHAVYGKADNMSSYIDTIISRYMNKAE